MNIILMSIAAGIFGTGMGGVLTTFFGKRTDRMIGAFLSFAGGVMTSVVFFELIPDAAAHAKPPVILAGMATGVVLVLTLNRIIDKISVANRRKFKLHDTYENYFHAGGIFADKNPFIRSGMLMFLAIGLHNIPEGLAIGAAGYHDAALGLTLALIIGIHNIPEGMAISVPLISGGLKKRKAVLLTILAGMPTVIGAAIGLLAGSVSDLVIAVSYSVAGGAMLYAVYGEILPQSVSMSRDRVPTLVLLFGIAFGYIMTCI